MWAHIFVKTAVNFDKPFLDQTTIMKRTKCRRLQLISCANKCAITLNIPMLLRRCNFYQFFLHKVVL